MADPFHAVTGVLGSFADWVADSNASFLAYRRYGPDWQEKLKAEAEKQQIEIDRLKNVRDISAENLAQERVDTLEKRGSFIGEAASALDDAERRRIFGRVDAGKVLEPIAESGTDGIIGDPRLEALYIQSQADQAVQDKAEQHATIESIQQQARAREASAVEREEQAKTTRALRPEKVRSQQAQTAQRQSAADLNVARQATEKERATVQKLDAELKRMELKGEKVDDSDIMGRAEVLLGGAPGVRQRLIGIADEIMVARGMGGVPIDKEGAAPQIRNIPADVFTQAVSQLKNEMRDLGGGNELAPNPRDVTLPSTLPDIPDVDQQELEDLKREMVRFANVPRSEWPEEFRRRVERMIRLTER